MAKRVNLDAMIRREDFARQATGETPPSGTVQITVEQLKPGVPIRRLLRKPDFQRETNHWSPDQILKFLTSYLDGNVIPSIILWKSDNFVFVIDGAHRLSALCAWIEDDYGDMNTTKSFYSDQISKEQIKIAKQTRTLINEHIGTYASVAARAGSAASEKAARRALHMFTSPVSLQMVSGDAAAAEDSFFAINQQGTILDETEELLIRNRRKPVGIGARAIVRAGAGNKYWSVFTKENQVKVEELSRSLHESILSPQAETPLKSLDLPLGGSSSPVEALGVLVEFLVVVNSKTNDKIDAASSYPDDSSGEATIGVLKTAQRISDRMTGNVDESLGLHPAIYFTNDKGKHNRFLYLGVAAAITEKLRNNDGGWFFKFTANRKAIERFLIDHKSFLGIVLQNMAKGSRVAKMRDLFNFLVVQTAAGKPLDALSVAKHLNLKGKVYDFTLNPAGPGFSEDTKSQIAYRSQIELLPPCGICGGALDIKKSVSFDHIDRVQDGGTGDADNGQMAHHYCNTGYKEKLESMRRARTRSE
jgi:hypothetical protein